VSADLLAAWREAQLAEIAWLDADGAPGLTVVVPLMAEGRPAAALTYDRLGEAQRIGAARRVVLAVTSPGSGSERVPVVASTRLEVSPDPRGQTFTDRLLIQELAKYPPSRRRADSVLLRREHWWYLPRLLLRAGHLERSEGQPPRDGLAAVATGDGLVVTTVSLEGPPEAPRLGSHLPDGRVVILQHGADDVPHLDRTWQRRWWGGVVGGELRVEHHAGRGPGSPPDGVWRRWRDEVAFERACRAGLRQTARPHEPGDGTPDGAGGGTPDPTGG
jgi:hypothetical protein